ncbi:benzoate/H(+) symporter BenE family transporter [Janibacter sp. YIM B02568]|nr:benzoate/H(+) symporter BenE family transporter [Janibacter endophyticus]
MAGVVSGLVGFTSSFAVVLAGLHAVGADASQATSGLTVLALAMGLGCVIFSLRTRMPITLAWSTPGAALLAASAAPAGGWPAAVGTFVVTGLLLALLALVRPLARLVAAIPDELAAAMLAGVLLVLCVAPFRALADDPAVIAPVILAWAAGLVLLRRWAVPIALAVALVVMLVEGSLAGLGPGDLMPVLDATAPILDPGALVAIAIPLVVVTTTSQNVPGIAVLRSFGYAPDPRPPLVYAGLASAATAPLGGHGINLAAISAALAAGPEAGPDPGRRWLAGVSCGVTYLTCGVLTPLVVAVASGAPAGLLETIAGLALLGTLAAAAASAFGPAGHREAAALTFVVAASGVTIAGIGGAFWGLVAGGALLVALRLRAHREAPRT